METENPKTRRENEQAFADWLTARINKELPEDREQRSSLVRMRNRILTEIENES